MYGCGDGSPTAPLVDPDSASVQTYHEGSRLILERVANGEILRVGLEGGWGGTIAEVSYNRRNLVNSFDAGREIQLAVYDGSHRYDGCASCEGIWGWNPVQGGDRYSNGSKVLEQRLDEASLYVKVRPNEWFPDDKGGGFGLPVPSDIVMEQWVESVPEHPRAFRIRYRITHEGADRHLSTDQQEFPAIYMDRDLDGFLFYGGRTPWRNAAVTSATLPRLFKDPRQRVHASEWWGAFVDRSGKGLTVYTPGSYPYLRSGYQPGSSGPSGSGAVYTHPYTPFGLEPRSRLEGEFYLIVGDWKAARRAVYDLHRSHEVEDIAAPMGAIEQPLSGAALSGSFEVRGWAFDNVSVDRIEILIDGKVVKQTHPMRPRSDVASRWPSAPQNSGFAHSIQTSAYPSGQHVITARIFDSSGHASEDSVRVQFLP